MKNVIHAICLTLLIGSIAMAADWPSFRNDLQNSGNSTETGLLQSWPEGGPELLWSIEGKFGLGWSSCAIVNDVVYTAGMEEATRQGILYAISSKGEILWQKPYGPEWIKNFRGSRGTPTVVDGKIFIMTGNGLLTCFTTGGEQVWQVDVAKNYGIKAPMFGMSESVLVIDGKAICSVGSSKASMVAFNVADGKEVWTAKSMGSNTSYCSAGYIKHKGQDMAVTMFGDLVMAVDPANGEVLWSIKYDTFEARGAGMGGDVRANTPLYWNGKIVISAGYDKGTTILDLADDCRSVKVFKYVQAFDNQHHGVVIHNGMLYGSNYLSNETGNWMCMDLATGEIKYEHNWDSGKGEMIFADGYLYCYNEKTGKFALVKADPAGFNITGSFTVTKGSGEHWAHPAISNGRLYVRHGDMLAVYKISK